MKYLLSVLMFLSTIGFINQSYAQTYTTESKSCGSCGKAVSNNSKIGMRCPHCGVRWGYENETRTTNHNKTYKQPSNSYQSSYDTPIGMVYNNVNLRSKPSTKASVLKVIPAYSSVTIIQRVGDWYYAKYSDIDLNSFNTRTLKGYLHKSVVK